MIVAAQFGLVMTTENTENTENTERIEIAKVSESESGATVPLGCVHREISTQYTE